MSLYTLMSGRMGLRGGVKTVKGVCEMAKNGFKLSKGLKKALLAGGAVAVGMAGAVSQLGGLSAPEQVTAITGIGALVAGIRLGVNWWKVNKDLANKGILR